MSTERRVQDCEVKAIKKNIIHEIFSEKYRYKKTLQVCIEDYQLWDILKEHFDIAPQIIEQEYIEYCNDPELDYVDDDDYTVDDDISRVLFEVFDILFKEKFLIEDFENDCDNNTWVLGQESKKKIKDFTLEDYLPLLKPGKEDIFDEPVGDTSYILYLKYINNNYDKFSFNELSRFSKKLYQLSRDDSNVIDYELDTRKKKK